MTPTTPTEAQVERRGRRSKDILLRLEDAEQFFRGVQRLNAARDMIDAISEIVRLRAAIAMEPPKPKGIVHTAEPFVPE